MADVPISSEEEPLLPEDNIQLSKENTKFPSCRVVLAFMCFLGFVNVYALRVNLSVALVAMVNTTTPIRINGSSECPGQVMKNGTFSNGEFNWDSELQGYILGAFFYGYILTQLLGGRMAERVGGKYLFGLGVLCTALLTLLTPLAARASPYFFMILRVFEGFGEGVTFPAMHAILSKWAPPMERSKLGTFIYAGSQMGTVISMPLSGYISDTLGWPWVFYIFGAIGCVWFVAYVLLVYDSPAKHPRISPEEKRYLETAIGPDNNKVNAVPWLSIAQSVPFWALAVTHFSYNWGFYTLLTSLPKYMSDVLHFDISANGLLSALPYISMWVVIVLTGQLADFTIERGYLSTTTVRKLASFTGLTVPAVSMVVVSYMGCDQTGAVVVLVIGGGMAGISQSGYNVNHLDLAPLYAGTLMGLTNTIATIPGFLSPEVVGWITNGDPSAHQWQKVFFISAAIYVFGAIVFAVFGSGAKQKWAVPEDQDTSDINPESRDAQVPDHTRSINEIL